MTDSTDRWPAECEKCGCEADTFEEARIHARDKHGGIKPGMLDIFGPSTSNDEQSQKADHDD